MTSQEDQDEDGESNEENENQQNISQPDYHQMMMHQAMMSGPLMAQAMLPTQMMMAASNPYMNPMHPLHPFNHQFNVQHHYMTPSGMMTLGGSDGDASHLDDDFHMQTPIVKVRSHCTSVKKQALEIANTMMVKQNHVVFKRLMNYLLKSKYLIGMTEIKLTRKLRRNIFSIMKGYSNVTDENVHFTGESGGFDDFSEASGDATIKSLDSSMMTDGSYHPNSPSEQMDHMDGMMKI